LAYVDKNTGELKKVGKSLTMAEALGILGIKKASCSISQRFTLSQNTKAPSSCKGSEWGVYSSNQVYASALATVLGCTSSPEIHGSGLYGHYHDKNRVIHIWYGYQIFY
jgi:hypothetical protein